MISIIIDDTYHYITISSLVPLQSILVFSQYNLSKVNLINNVMMTLSALTVTCRLCYKTYQNKIYNGQSLLTSGAGKTCQPLVKE